MFTLIALKYARFRHKNKMLGRMVELSVVALFFGAIAALCITSNLDVMLYAFGVALFCMAMCFFFKEADALRNLMPD